MVYRVDFDKEKSIWLRQTRGVDFGDVLKALDEGNLIDDIKHPNQKRYPNQRMLVLRIKDYVYIACYVVDRARGVKFIKTVYPSRKYTKRFINQQKVRR